MDYIIVSFVTLYSLWQVIIIFQRIYDILELAQIRKKEANKLITGKVVKEHLCYLTPNEFEEWCCLFLRKSGYENIRVGEQGAAAGKGIICTRNGKKVYVECQGFPYTNGMLSILDAGAARKLAGTMVHDGVEQGIIITTGFAGRGVMDYVKSLTPEYGIHIIDGEMLIQNCDNLCKAGILITAI